MLMSIWAPFAAWCSVAVALLHVYVIVQGPWAYRFFGAGEQLATMAEQGSWVPTLLTSGITIVFFAFAAYYFAAASWIPRLPFFKWALIGIAAVYTLRGAMVIPALLVGMKISPFDLWSSLTSLAIGLIHCLAAWQALRRAL
ncbi:hypothetical protein P3W85_20725 [Cupriavidus basilensis]|uniref:Uncharacterized protein n=1 Tax=Cupriavidus basilensis TaxID=68895 RepID=A0ABT6AUJ0_9BURK|nr:hypothetical protein [Cupriavidus basilensis]MDF3835361.1 hypothetical protein [Cupriavidus basilensis]